MKMQGYNCHVIASPHTTTMPYMYGSKNSSSRIIDHHVCMSKIHRKWHLARLYVPPWKDGLQIDRWIVFLWADRNAVCVLMVRVQGRDKMFL